MDREHLRLAARAAEAEPAAVPAEDDRGGRPRLSAPGQAVAAPEEGAARAEVEPRGRTLAEAPALAPVSVVIVSYNCKAPLVDCLESLAAERAEVPLEVVLVDNDSTDDTAYAVATRFAWVKLIVNRGNLGFARAVNEGVRFTHGEYILVLNPDTIVPPGTIARAVAELERRPEVGMLGCRLVRPDGTFDHACKRGFPTVMSALYYFAGLARAFPRNPRFAQYTAAHLASDETGVVDSVNGAFMLVRRAAAEEVGELDERYWLWAEDLDWCRRFWAHGWQVLYWPEAEVVHLKGASVGDHRSFRLNFAFHRSIWLFYEKHHAPRRSAFVSGLVWLGVWSKFAGSALANVVRARASNRRR